VFEENRYKELERCCEQIRDRFPAALHFALSLYANYGMFLQFGPELRTLMLYACVVNYEVNPRQDEDLSELWKSVDPKELVDEVRLNYYEPLGKYF